MINFLLILFSISLFFLIIVLLSIYIHINMKDTKIKRFVNKHIIADEDDYIK